MFAFICPSVCLQDDSESFGQILTKIFGGWNVWLALVDQTLVMLQIVMQTPEFTRLF